MARKSLIAFCLLAVGLSGCRWLAYVFAPLPEKKTVKAEYAHLPGRSVAIIVFADQGVLYEHPYVREEVSAMIGHELAKRVKEAKVLDPQRVIKFQDERIEWDAMDKTALGKAFGVDYVLFISLVQFTMRESGSMTLYRARISAEASLYKTSLPEPGCRVWRNGDIRVIHPPHGPVGRLKREGVRIRRAAIRLLAEKLVRSFHKHKVSEDEER